MPMTVFLLVIAFLLSLMLNIWQVWHFHKSKEIWIENAAKTFNEFERIKRITQRLQLKKEGVETSRNQPLRSKNHKYTSTENKILAAGLEFSKGPDEYSLTILRNVTQWKEGGIYAPVAHYWFKSEWWNLIGLPEEGRGLEKMIFALSSGGFPNG